MNNHLLLDIEYIEKYGRGIEGFTKKGNNVWNMRCPLCGDSSKSKFKRRGYILQNKNEKFVYYCHNCGTSISLRELFQETDNILYEEYSGKLLLEGKQRYLEQKQKQEEELKIRVKSFQDYLGEMKKDTKYLVSLQDLPISHEAVQYLLDRKVKESEFYRVFWTTKYEEIVHKGFGEKYINRHFPNEGLVFKLTNPDTNDIVGLQFRSIDVNIPKTKRFATVKLDGIEGIFKTENKPIQFVIEGTIDGLILSGCNIGVVSTLNSNLSRMSRYDQAIFVNDNEPRNPEIVKLVHKCILKGLKTCLLPEKYQGMDINDLYISLGCDDKKLISELTKYSFSGLQANLRFTTWRKDV